MNSRTSFALLAILATVVTLTMSSAYAQYDVTNPACVGCNIDDDRAAAESMLMQRIPVSVWTDRTEYGHNDIVKVEGRVANVSGFPITILVVSPQNNLVTIDQLIVADDGSFETTLNTSSKLWKYDGTYTIRVNYGSAEKSNTIRVELTGGVPFTPSYATPDTAKQCGVNQISASGHCITYSISGGMVTGATLNTDDNSIVISINAEDDGTLTVSPTRSQQEGIFMVLVDGEEWDDVDIVGNGVTIMFLAGAEEIEVIGTFVIPEFGTIAAMILAVAIISIIAISAKSRLSIIPRY